MDLIALANMPSEKRMAEMQLEQMQRDTVRKKERRTQERRRIRRRKLVETLTNFICGSLMMGAFYALIVFFLLFQG